MDMRGIPCGNLIKRIERLSNRLNNLNPLQLLKNLIKRIESRSCVLFQPIDRTQGNLIKRIESLPAPLESPPDQA